jgi:hypothetical protein
MAPWLCGNDALHKHSGDLRCGIAPSILFPFLLREEEISIHCFTRNARGI